jgi:hypothetical protein
MTAVMRVGVIVAVVSYHCQMLYYNIRSVYLSLLRPVEPSVLAANAKKAAAWAAAFCP